MANETDSTIPDETIQEPIVQPETTIPAESAEPEAAQNSSPEISIDATPIASTVGDSEVAPPIPSESIPETNSVETVIEKPGIYIVEAADLNAYPELSEQGVQYKDDIEFGSKWVNKYDTAQKDSFHREAWPVNIEPIKNGIAFKE